MRDNSPFMGPVAKLFSRSHNPSACSAKSCPRCGTAKTRTHRKFHAPIKPSLKTSLARLFRCSRR